MDGMIYLANQDNVSKKKVYMRKLLQIFLYILLYGPIISSYILVGYHKALLEKTGTISENTMIFLDEYTDIALVVSFVVIISIVALLCVVFFTKKKLLSTSLWLHCDIVFVLWLFFLFIAPAVGFFYD